MEARLQWMARPPKRWVHWAPLRGGLQAQALLEQRYPDSECFMADPLVSHAEFASKKIAKPWWGRLFAKPDRVHWVEPEAPVDMLWANMALHMAADPQDLIAHWHRLLAVDGFVMFSCLGPDTLRELRSVYAAQGWPAPAHEFTDMHDWGDMLVAAGFAQPVMDVERIHLTFESPQRLLLELRELGRNLHVQRFQNLRGRQWLGQLHQAMRERLAVPAESGRLKLGFEIIYGHAFKAAPRLPVSERSVVSLDQMRGALGLGSKSDKDR
jgi:malonyl-CoA O-methyltransferase